MAAALVPYLVVMLPIATVGAVGMIAWGLWWPRKTARSSAVARSAIKYGRIRTIRTMTASKS